MRIALVYIAVTHGSVTADFASRFVASYNEFPPEHKHDTIIACNGGPLSTELALIFSSIPALLYPRSNDGWDIGAYIELAKGVCRDYDMMLCCGESVYCHRAGWLRRFYEAAKRLGPGMYGPFASNLIRGHLQTTCFFTSPKLLAEYPQNLWGGSDRYAFEHGPLAFWRWCAKRMAPVRLVTWDGDYGPKEWRVPHNILWRGNQSNCLLFSNHTERFASADFRVKNGWARGADSQFK